MAFGGSTIGDEQQALNLLRNRAIAAGMTLDTDVGPYFTAVAVLASALTDGFPAVISPTGVLGFGTGAGGAVTQITSAATGVTLSKPCGQITTVALTTAAAAEEAFVVTNTLVAATDVIATSTTYAGAGKPIVSVTNVGAGVFTVNITNVSANALDAVLVVNFAVIKSVAA